MKILHIITSLESGGTEKNLLNLIKFDNNKNDHIVFALKPFGFHQKELANKVKVFTPNKTSLYALLKFLFFLRSFCNKNREKIDVIHSWNYQTNLISTILSGKKKIWNIRSSGEKIYNSPKRLLYVCLNGFFSLFSDKIIFNSHKTKNQHLKFFFNKNLIVIQNGFLLNKYKLKHKKSQRINYLCIARNDYYKDHNNLIKSFLLFDQKFKNWKLYIIGKGNENILEKFDLETNKEFKKKIIIINETRNLKKYMNISHFHVLPSLGESFPNVVGETMNHGIINIGSDVGDTKYLIKDKDFLVKPENSEALSKSLLKSKKLYLENYPEYLKKCKDVKELINNKFKYLNYYQSFILETKKIILKKFLFILPTLNIGGAERVTTEIIKTSHLIKKDIKTDILVLGKKSNYEL
jgi:glycosyltransferase involved in cell wall biosynthesis